MISDPGPPQHYLVQTTGAPFPILKTIPYMAFFFFFFTCFHCYCIYCRLSSTYNKVSHQIFWLCLFCSFLTTQPPKKQRFSVLGVILPEWWRYIYKFPSVPRRIEPVYLIFSLTVFYRYSKNWFVQCSYGPWRKRMLWCLWFFLQC